MGDGGVACVPLQHVMERFQLSETYCGGNGGISSKSLQFAESTSVHRKQHEKKMGVEKAEFGSDKSRKGELEKGGHVSLSRARVGGEVEKGEILERQLKEEVEEGELGFAREGKDEVENGEFVPEKLQQKREFEKGEIVAEKWRRGDVEKGEFTPEKWRRREPEKRESYNGRYRGDELEKGEFLPDKWRKGQVVKSEFGFRKGRIPELEKGEFVPDRWRKSEVVKDEFSSARSSYSNRRRDQERDYNPREKGWKCEQERTPNSKKNADDDTYFRKDYAGSGYEWRKRPYRWDPNHDKDPKISSRQADDELGSSKYGHSDGKSYGKDYSSGSWLKRHNTELENSSRRCHGDANDYSVSKSRRISDDSSRSGYQEKRHSHTSVDRAYRNTSSSSSSARLASSRYSSGSRHYEFSSTSRGMQERHGRSPGNFERSPRDRNRQHDPRDRSPAHLDKSPNDRSRQFDRRAGSPARERSPLGRPRNRDGRDQTPSYLDKSPIDRGCSPRTQARHPDHRDRSPGRLERSSLDRGLSHDHKESSRKSGGGTEVLQSQLEIHKPDEKLGQTDSTDKDSNRLSSSSQPHDNDNLSGACGSLENGSSPSYQKEEPQTAAVDCPEPLPQTSEAMEEFSMEEDMDISNTPPHAPARADSPLGTWFYLDYLGLEQGPSNLCDLKRLVEEGVLQSDHLIKHMGSDWWVTVENAASPLVSTKFPPIVSDAITQLVNPPEAPGNVLLDGGDGDQSFNQPDEESSTALLSPPPPFGSDNNSASRKIFENLYIDERVEALLNGHTVIPGKELETLGEALQMTFERMGWQKQDSLEGFMRSWLGIVEPYVDQRDGELGAVFDNASKEVGESRSIASCDKDFVVPGCVPSDWFSNRWSCKGGDWKRNDETVHDKSFRRKLVLNDGYPLCQMPKSGYEDPRWHREDELYCPSHSRRLDLATWAFSLSEDRNDSSGTSKSSQMKTTLIPRGVKGTVLPVVRINACVVNSRVSFVSEPRMAVRGNDRNSSRSVRNLSSSSDGRSLSVEAASRSKRFNEQEWENPKKCIAPISTPTDHVCTVDELQLHLGGWYYLDGAGHEHGPASFSELQVSVEKGTIQNCISVFRKLDNIWVPVSSNSLDSKPVADLQEQSAESSTDTSVAPFSQKENCKHDLDESSMSLFHRVHPQFIGFTRGKLHELVMKSFKSREFAAAIHEVLDPWICSKQPRKEIERHPMSLKSRKPEDDYGRAGKRARLLADDSEEDYDLGDDLSTGYRDETPFEELCSSDAFRQENCTYSEAESQSWGLLDGHLLARVFHFLSADLKSLAFSAATCKHWNAVIKIYKDISRQVNLSALGPNCSDSMLSKIMNSYDKVKITSVILTGCTSISARALEEILHSFPCISSVDIRGCSQFRELFHNFQNIKWIKDRNSRENKNFEGSHSKMRSLQQITEKSQSLPKSTKGHFDESSDRGDVFYDSAIDKWNSSTGFFRQSLYKRKKLPDMRKASSFFSREARMRRLLHRKSENGYKKMEEFLTSNLKDIMKENCFDFFTSKVAEIEERIKNGYYMRRGLNSVKDDISRMCRDAIKAKSRGNPGNMNHIIMLFIKLATSLEENSKSSHQRDEMLKMLKDESATSEYKKKNNKSTSERKHLIRNNGIGYANGNADYGDYASDREIKRRLSKLNRRTLDSESETSDDLDRSSEDIKGDGESSNSDTESDLELNSGVGMQHLRREKYFTEEETLDSEDREWGARMTKSSLVPPVTRKYEVIDKYIIVEDEKEVQRKMRVSLPDNYTERLAAQKNGNEESDMDFPEVKEFKPRKELGEEVLEQEVYGIDPYTHNLLLDSMPEEFEWPLSDKHLFVEDVLLRTLNMQVRRFTGSGNAPMKYPLQPVIEEIQRTAEENCDKRTMRMCQGILKAIRSRPEDNYVAYRKGLGVVCNRVEGFGLDDFVVEFLGEVYPAWKWYEKQDGIRILQKNNKDPAPEFYNIYLERPKGDSHGYDVLVVDAMHKANYASRICHSCRPNCEAKVTAVDGHYQIGVHTLRPIGFGEEITFDYNSVTESKEEHEESVCLCGSQVCRGSYLNFTGDGAFLMVLREFHGVLDRHNLLLEACALNSVSEEDYIDLGKAGLGSCLLDGLPDWLIAYSARLVRFINFERTKLPREILRINLEEKRKFFSDICLDNEKNEAEIQAEGVYNQRLQNLAVTLNKVKYVMKCGFGDPKLAPPPLEKLNPEAVVSALWKGEGSFLEEILQCMTPHVGEDLLNKLKSKIDSHDPSASDDVMGQLHKSLLWLRDEVRSLPCTNKCRHDAAADLIHMYAYTKCFYRVQEYKTVTSPPVYISPLDLGPKYSDKIGPGLKEYRKTYSENYCLGQLIYWYTQDYVEPHMNLVRASRGCLVLPDIASFYQNNQKTSKELVYGPRILRFMLSRMEKQPQRPWPKDRIWRFKSNLKVFGSPNLDAVVNKSSLDRDMVQWLKSRSSKFHAL
ncbi:hypothetical protein Sjap_003400 [Stephania japonica]|uniref:SET domain-containing protein n=1 Tax=Stephania japonica TaxID=461633 RepID=A0AAP0PV10_9MAGN